MTSNNNSLIDTGRRVTPNHLPPPESPSSIESDDFHTAASSSPSSGSPVASPLPPPLLNSALRALGSPGAQATDSDRQAPQSHDDDELILDGVSELGRESTADSLELSPDSAAAPIHQTPNLLGRVSAAPTSHEVPADDVLRPLPRREYPTPQVVHRRPAESLQEVEARAAPASLHQQEKPPRLVMFGSSFASAAARIPGMQTLGNLWHAMPSTQTILNRLGLAAQPLPDFPIPTDPQIQHLIPAIDEDAPAHIAIPMPPRITPDDPDDGSDSSDSSSSSSSSSRSTESDVRSNFSGIISERDSPVPDEWDIPARSAAACRPVETYLHLGLAPLLPNPTRAAVATPDLRAAQPEHPEQIGINIQPVIGEEVQELPIPDQHNSGPTTILSQVGNFFETLSSVVAPQPPRQGNLGIYQQLSIRPRPDPVATLLGEARELTPARVTVTYTGRTPFSRSAQGERDMVLSPNSRPPAPQLTPFESQLSPYDHWHQRGAMEDPAQPGLPLPVEPTVWGMTQAGMQAVRDTAHGFAGLVDIARTLTTPQGVASIRALREAALGPVAPAPAAAATAAEPSALTVAANGIALAQQLLPFAIQAAQHPEHLTATIATTRQAIMAGLSDAPEAPQPPIALGVANLGDILHPEGPAQAPPPSLMQTATTLLSGLTQVIQNPHQAGRDLRAGFSEFIGGATGAERRDPSASAAASDAAPADATPQGFFSQIFTGLRNGATKKFTELRFAGIALTLAQKVADMEESPVKAQLNEMLAAIGRFQKGAITQQELEATLTRIMNGQDENGQQIRNFLHIHINGFELPIRTEGVGSAQQTLDAIQAAHPLLPQTTQTAEDHRISVQVRQARLVTNISTMAPLNLVNELLCGGLLSKEKIAEILGKNRHDTNYDSIVRKAFYAELDNLFILRRWAAKFTYWAFSGLSSTILSSFIQGLLEKVQSSVNVVTPQRQQDIHNSVITGINKGLTVYNLGVKNAKAALEGRPSDDVIISDSDTMLGNELARPPYNEGETKESLYNKAIDKAVNEILPPLGWTKSLKHGIRKLPGWGQALLFPLTSIAWIVVAGSEWASDFIIRSIIRNVVKYTKILDTVIDLSVEQISRNGYTHAINKLVLQQLKLIGDALDNEDSGAISTSMANKEVLRNLAKELFKTLETQRREGQVDTNAATTLENFKRSVYQLTSDLSADAIALIIDQAKNIILDPTMIAMRQDTLLEALNAALESSTTESREAMIALEEEIIRQSDIILNKALKKIVHTTLVHKPAEVQEACTRFTKQLKDKATAFVTQLTSQVGNKSTFETSIGEFAATMRGLLNEAKNDPLLEDSAATIEQLITPIANITTSLRADLPENQLRALLNELAVCISNLQEIIHVDAQIVEGVMKKMESITSQVAYQGGKEFFNEAWKLLTKKPVWRFAAHRAMLSFVKS